MLSIPLNENLEDFYKKQTNKTLSEAISTARDRGVYHRDNHLTLNPTAIYQLLQPTFNKIKQEIKTMLEYSELRSGLKYVFLVGGFAESEFLRRALCGSLAKYDVVIPCEPQSTLLKAAVSYACDTSDDPNKFKVEVLSEGISTCIL